MGFLEDLSGSLLEQVGLAENAPGNLDFKGKPYGKIGDLASQIDTTAHRQYLESGAIRNVRPRASEVIMQEPDISVVIKKRIFSSLAESYRTDLMDQDDKLFLRATKQLFYNKMRVIAAYERLTKFNRIASKNEGTFSDYALPAIFSSVDILSTAGLINQKTQAVFETIRKVKRFSDPQFFSTWNIASELPYASETGQGTGTFDLTLVSQINCKNSVLFGQGNANISVEDPYKLTIITNEDIEQAISDATSLFKQSNFFSFTQTQLERTINDLKDRLNQVRMQRGASRIFFLVNEDTILFKKVRAIIDEEGREIGFSFDAGILGINTITGGGSVSVDPQALEGINGLQGQEINVFKQIVNNMYLLMSLAQTTQSQNREYNLKTNYIRKKMDLHYLNKPIIQPMDVVYIFASSKTLRDAKVVEGLKYNFSSDSLLNNINDTVSNIESSLNDLKDTFSGGGSGTSSLEQEKNAIAGPDFPLWLYGMMRNDFTRSSSGTCIFAGLAKQASHSYNADSGKYTLNVTCGDNTTYLSMGQINTNPSVEVFNSSLYDPLTPFKSDFDEASGVQRGEFPELLDANVRLLSSRSVRAKLGRWRGSGIDESIFKLRDVENVNGGKPFEASRQFSRMLRHKYSPPDGFVYRWKEGIGSLVLWGEPYSNFDVNLGSFRAETSPSITTNPFAGQDVMNVLSLLITGQPYNFNNFVRGAIEFGKLSKNDLTNKDLSVSFFKGLITQIVDQNATWGNFVPFKKLIINESAYEFLASGQVDISVKNERLNQLIRRRAEAFDELTSVAPQLRESPSNYGTGIAGIITAQQADPAEIGGLVSLAFDVTTLDADIKEAQDAFFESISNVNLQSAEGTLGIFGDDISFDPTVTGTDNEENEEKRRRARQELRARTNYLTRRRIWKVRANEDPNLFIVDDSYDKNYDIRAFELELADKMNFLNSTYQTVDSQVQMAATMLGLEVFADSQGHINARPPQYNRMPSSVFRNMLQKRAQTGIQIFPSYLERLFFTSLQGLADELEIVEDQIRLRAAALGRLSDGAASQLLAGSGSGGSFEFLTNRNTGKLSNDIRSLIDQDDPDLQQSRNSGALEEFSDVLRGPYNAKVTFNATARLAAVQDPQSFTGNINNINNEIAKLSNRLFRRTRQQQPANLQAVFSNSRIVSLAGRSQVDILNVTNKISQFISQRQRLIKRLALTVKNLRAGVGVNATDSSSSQDSLIFPTLFQKKERPEILEHMIEDEDNDDYGLNSGSRFIIDDAQIKSLTITEMTPPYNMVQVDGKLGGGIVRNTPGLETGDGGNGIATAWAVDYDMWRMYGLKVASKGFSVPFFSDPVNQCAPYAVFLLNLARKNILQGSCTVAGNEYMQAGEVYYIEDRDMLFYAESVEHEFGYNSAFETRLDLKYGRNPGEYIPTHLDIIGKTLYANRHQAELTRQVRHGRVDNSNHIGTLIFDNSVSVETNSDALRALVGGEFGDSNRQTLSNMLLIVSGVLTPSTFSKVLTLEIRTYKNTDAQVSLEGSDNLSRVADAVKSWVIDPSNTAFNDGETLIPTSEDPPRIDANRVKTETVDLNPGIFGEIRSPSNTAWSAARSVASRSSISTDGESITAQEEAAGQSGADTNPGAQKDSEQKDLLKREISALTNSVVDIWVTFTDPVQVLQGSKTPSGNDQASQEEQEQIDNAG
jgi:hypothetical protein